jgi:methylmalonyl-CoA mutase N-terminal domain/subunit
MTEKELKIMNVYGEGFLNRFRNKLIRWKEEIVEGRMANGDLKPEFWTRHGQKEKTKAEFKSGSGELTIKEIYTPLDVSEIDPIDQVGLPGEYPYTRGRDPLGPQAVNLPLKFYSGYGSSEEVKERYRRLYQAGARFIVLALDLPSQIGYDSDSPIAAGEVGKVGVALDTLADMERLFEGLPLDRISTGTVGNCIGPWALAMFFLTGKKTGVDPSKMKVNLQNDPFKEYTGRGTFIFPPRVALDLASDTVAYICKHLSHHWEPQYYCTTTLRWGGCNVSQEVGFGIANLIAYVEAAQKKGVPPEQLIPRTNLHMTADMDLFEEVAKFRATRRLWAKIAARRFGTNDPRVTSLRITVYTGANRLTAQQPLNNIIRVTIQVLSSMLGGVETISIPAYDEAHALPTEESTRLASLTPHILNDECMVGNTGDPLGGSYYVEWLTDKIEENASQWYKDVEARGGALLAVESGYYLRQMADGLYKYHKEVEFGERKIIGVNKFTIAKDEPIQLFKNDPEGERKQIETLKKVKQERDNNMVKKCLTELKKVAQDKANGKGDNIVPAVIEAVGSYASIGEIFGILRQVYGEYKPPIII